MATDVGAKRSKLESGEAAPQPTAATVAAASVPHRRAPSLLKSKTTAPRAVAREISLPAINHMSLHSLVFPEPQPSAAIVATAVTPGVVEEDALIAIEDEALKPDRLGAGGVRSLLQQIRRATSRQPGRATALMRAMIQNFRGDADLAAATTEWAEKLGVPDDASSQDQDGLTTTSSAGAEALIAQLEGSLSPSKDNDLLMWADAQRAAPESGALGQLLQHTQLHLPMLEAAERVLAVQSSSFFAYLVEILGAHGGMELAFRANQLFSESQTYDRAIATLLQRANTPNSANETAAYSTRVALLFGRSAVAPSVLLGSLAVAAEVAERVASHPRAHAQVAAKLSAAMKPLLTAADAVVSSAGCISQRAAAACGPLGAAGEGLPPRIAVALMDASAKAAAAPLWACARAGRTRLGLPAKTQEQPQTQAPPTSASEAAVSPVGGSVAAQEAERVLLDRLRAAVAQCAACFVVALPGEGDPRLQDAACGCDSAVVATGARRLLGGDGRSHMDDAASAPAAATLALAGAQGADSADKGLAFYEGANLHAGAAEMVDAAMRASAAHAAPPTLAGADTPTAASSSASSSAPGHDGNGSTSSERAAQDATSPAPAYLGALSHDDAGGREGDWRSLANARGMGGLDACAAAGVSRGRLPAACSVALERLCQAIEAVQEALALPGSSDQGEFAGSAVESAGPSRPLPSASPASTSASVTPARGAEPGSNPAATAFSPAITAAAALVRLPALVERLLALLFHPAAPIASPHTLAFASRALAFATAAPDDQAGLARHLQTTASLCHDAESGVSVEGMAGRLALAADFAPCAAGGVLLWCRAIIGSASLTQGAVFRAEAEVVVRLVAKVAERQPRVARRALVVLRRTLRVRKSGAEAVETTKLHAAAIRGIVLVMATTGAAVPAMELLEREISVHELDASLARSAVAQVLECATIPFTRQFVEHVLLLLVALARRGAHEGMSSQANMRASAALRGCADVVSNSAAGPPGTQKQWGQRLAPLAREAEQLYARLGAA